MSKVQSRKAKGRNLQKHVVDVLTEVFDLEEGDATSCSMGAGGTDVLLSPAARKKIGLSVECKNTRGAPSIAALKQSKANAYKNSLPCVVYKPHGAKYEDALVYFTFTELCTWIKGMRID